MGARHANDTVSAAFGSCVPTAFAWHSTASPRHFTAFPRHFTAFPCVFTGKDHCLPPTFHCLSPALHRFLPPPSRWLVTGQTGEVCAAAHGIRRRQADQFAARSHAKVCARPWLPFALTAPRLHAGAPVHPFIPAATARTQPARNNPQGTCWGNIHHAVVRTLSSRPTRPGRVACWAGSLSRWPGWTGAGRRRC